MTITIVCVGKIKERYLRDGIAEYAKRLSRYCRVQFREVADERTPDRAPEALADEIRRTEGARILNAIPARAHVIALAIDGDAPDSVVFSESIEKLALRGESHIAFVIGGSLGLSAEVLARSDERISFSAMTFPHQLMRMILLEQIYRAFRIMRKEPYHK